MKRHQRYSLGLLCMFVVMIVIAILPPDTTWGIWQPDEPQPDNSNVAWQFVRQALEREIHGANSEREQLLKQAIDTAPDFPPGHWHLGEVQIREFWVPVNLVPEVLSHDRRLPQYFKRRERAKDNIESQLEIADWCREKGLPLRARAHYTAVLEKNSNHAEARKWLGYRKIDSAWIGPEEIEAAQQSRILAVRSLGIWKPRLERLGADILSGKKFRREQALQQFRQIKEASGILAIELVFGQHPQLAALAVDQFAEMKSYQASTALARLSHLSPWKPVRRAAIEKLKDRPWDDYIPVLLAELHSPLQSKWETYQSPEGRLRHRQVFLREKQEHKELAVFDTDYGLADDAGSPYRAVTAMIGATLTQQVGIAVENAQTQARNKMICVLLSEVTGQSMPPDPELWWVWRRAHNEVFVQGEKPVHRRYTQRVLRDLEGSLRSSLQSGGEQTSSDCLAAGTPVWTDRGLVAIDKLAVGDLVLSQDAESGALEYKPVLRTTIRPPGKLLKINMGKETIECSGGHPFWVSGAGWKKARQLRPGDRLHRMDGATPISSIQAGSDAETYNVIVADYHSFVIGKNRVLSHDNTIRRRTNAIVPGLLVQ